LAVRATGVRTASPVNRILIADADEGRAAQMGAGLRSCGLDAVVQCELAALPRSAVGSAAVVLDTDVAGVNASARERFAQFVRGLLFYRPELPLITIARQPDAALSVAMVALDVGWHFDQEPDAALLAAQLKRLLVEVAAVRQPAPWRVGQFLLDPVRGTAELRGAVLPLSPRELKLLELLMKQPGRVYSRQEIADAMRPHGSIASERAIDVVVSRLRQKLASFTVDGAHLLRTVTGVGYALAPFAGDAVHERR